MTSENSSRIKPGEHLSPNTEFKKGEHWREFQIFRDKNWLQDEYTNKNRSASDIAAQFGVTTNAIFFWLDKHNIRRRNTSEARKVKKWSSPGESNGMYNRTGSSNPKWLGGVTPERQSFYLTKEWKEACAIVWKRDEYKCKRCGTLSSECKIHVHHIVSFSVKELRSKTSNLVLLCKQCHNFVHSKKNVDHEFILKGGYGNGDSC